MLRRNQVLHFFSELSPCLVGVESCASALYQHIGNDSEFKVAIISLNWQPLKLIMNQFTSKDCWINITWWQYG